MEVEEIDFADSWAVHRYESLFEECPAAFIQQSTYWCNVIRDLGPDKPIFLLCNDRGKDIAGLPLYLYEHDLGNILTSVPQAGPLGGIFLREGISRQKLGEIYRILLPKAVEIGQRYKCMTLTIITNPFRDDLDLYERYLSPDFVFENFTQHIPLARPAHRSHGHRNNLNKARKFGYSVRFCETLEELTAWYELHRERHVEMGAVPLDYRLFENMFRELVPRKKAELILAKRDGEIASGGFYIHHGRVVDVFMTTLNRKYAKRGATFVTTDHSLQWSRELGLSIYNWQSLPTRQCGAYAYKKQWGCTERSYYFVTKLLCDPRKIEAIGIDNLRQQYAWHYVVPFGAFREGFDRKYFKKS